MIGNTFKAESPAEYSTRTGIRPLSSAMQTDIPGMGAPGGGPMGPGPMGPGLGGAMGAGGPAPCELGGRRPVRWRDGPNERAGAAAAELVQAAAHTTLLTAQNCHPLAHTPLSSSCAPRSGPWSCAAQRWRRGDPGRSAGWACGSGRASGRSAAPHAPRRGQRRGAGRRMLGGDCGRGTRGRDAGLSHVAAVPVRRPRRPRPRRSSTSPIGTTDHVTPSACCYMLQTHPVRQHSAAGH